MMKVETRSNQAARWAVPIVLALSSLAMLPLTLHAQCTGGSENPAIEATTPSDQFQPQADGTVLDWSTRLVWQRCALGQTWDGATCMGSAQLLNWTAALVAARDHVQADATDWRVPNRNELNSIVEARCHSPAINGEIFPATPNEWFWTNSPFRAQIGQAWVLPFTDGELQVADDSGLYAVRLVRGGRN